MAIYALDGEAPEERHVGADRHLPDAGYEGDDRLGEVLGGQGDLRGEVQRHRGQALRLVVVPTHRREAQLDPVVRVEHERQSLATRDPVGLAGQPRPLVHLTQLEVVGGEREERDRLCHRVARSSGRRDALGADREPGLGPRRAP